MSSAFGRMAERLHRIGTGRLNDALGSYTPPGGTTVCGLDLIVDRDLMQSGPEGMFRSDAVGVSWRKSQLSTAARGGIFSFGGDRLVVESVIADDGHMVTAACMVQS